MKKNNESRAIEWLLLRLQGYAIKEIAAKEGVSHRTVEANFEEMRKHYQAKDTLHLAGILMSKKVITENGFSADKLEMIETRKELNLAVEKLNQIIEKM